MAHSHYRHWFGLPAPRPQPAEPGMPRPVPPPAVAAPVIRLFAYGPDGFEETTVERPGDLAAWRGRYPVTWVDVDGVEDDAGVHGIAEMFNLHGLAEQDVRNPVQRPKVEAYGDHLFLVARMLFLSPGGTLESEQLSLFLGRGFIVTFQQSRPGDCLESVRQRLRKGEGHLRRQGADFLLWALLDATVDGYFPVLEAYGEGLEDLEERILEHPRPDCITGIHQAKRDLLSLRRVAWPLRDVLGALLRDDNPLVSAETRMFLRDCHDHLVQVIDMVETYREFVADLMDAYHSSVANRLNQVMKILTIIATVFMPLSFLAGVYGMNFHTEDSPLNMPELSWRYGYLLFWGVCVASVVGMVAWFRRQGWIGRDG